MNDEREEIENNKEEWKPKGLIEHIGYYIGGPLLIIFQLFITILVVLIAFKATMFIIDILKGWGWW